MPVSAFSFRVVLQSLANCSTSRMLVIAPWCIPTMMMINDERYTVNFFALMPMYGRKSIPDIGIRGPFSRIQSFRGIFLSIPPPSLSIAALTRVNLPRRTVYKLFLNQRRRLDQYHLPSSCRSAPQSSPLSSREDRKGAREGRSLLSVVSEEVRTTRCRGRSKPIYIS